MSLTGKKNKLKSRLSVSSSSNSLRMTAMIDVIFLLLIFFLLTAKFRPLEDFLPLNIPHQKSASVIAVEPLQIYISQSQNRCNIKIGDFEFSINSAAEKELIRKNLEKVLKSQSRYLTDPVEIICGTGVKWQHIASIYDTLYGSGLTDISFQLTE